MATPTPALPPHRAARKKSPPRTCDTERRKSFHREVLNEANHSLTQAEPHAEEVARRGTSRPAALAPPHQASRTPLCQLLRCETKCRPRKAGTSRAICCLCRNHWL